jgi:hypothetical protein
MRLLITVFLLLLLPNPSNANTSVDIINFELWSTTNGLDVIRVVPTSAAVVGIGCSDPDSYLVKTTMSDKSVNRIYATLLTAKISSRQVRLFVSGCELNRPAIVNVIML